MLQQAIAANLTLSRPGVVVALVLKTELAFYGFHGSDMAVAWQHIFMYLVGHLLTQYIGVRLHIGRSCVQAFVVVGEGKKLRDV